MQYYVIEWDHEEADEPWQVYLELDDTGHLQRKVEAYRFGLYESIVVPDAPLVDPRQFAGDSGILSPSHPAQFQDLWERCQEMPDGWMQIFF